MMDLLKNAPIAKESASLLQQATEAQLSEAFLCCCCSQTSDSNYCSRRLNKRSIVSHSVEIVSFEISSCAVTWQEAIGCDLLQLQQMPPMQTGCADFTVNIVTGQAALYVAFTILECRHWR